MSDDENNLTSDSYERYDDYDYDDYKYNSYDEPGLTDGDERPLTSLGEESAEGPLDEVGQNRGYSRRETIARVAEDQHNGYPRKPGVTAPDSRLHVLNSQTKRRPRLPRDARHRPATPVEPRPQQKSKFAMFYIAFLLLAVSVCLVVLVVLLPGMGQRFMSLPIIGGTPPTLTTADTPMVPILRQDLNSQTALIADIGTRGAGSLHLLDIGTRRSDYFSVKPEAIIAGRNNRSMTLDELRVGDIVDILYDSDTNEIARITENTRRWERIGRTNVTVNMEDLTINHANDVWNFNSQTIVTHQGDDFSIGQIRPYDSVTLVGYGDTVWLVRVETAHGFLQFANTDSVINGYAMIGSDQHISFEHMQDDIVLPEGMHVIMVDGDNIEQFFQNVRIIQGQTERINLAEAELLTARLFITVTPEYAQIFINGEEHINSEPAEVDFGEVLIRVELDGYHPQQQELEITSEMMSVTFELEEFVVESTLAINTSPAGALIYINDERVGVAPVTQSLPPGMHSVVARIPGYESATISVPVTGNETANIERTLVLMPVVADPMVNQPPPVVEPIPSPPPVLPTPPVFPTITPSPPPTPVTPSPPPFYVPDSAIPPSPQPTPQVTLPPFFIPPVPLPPVEIPPAEPPVGDVNEPPPAGDFMVLPSPPPMDDIPWWLQEMPTP